MDYDVERERQASTELRKAFRELFPLAGENDLPWAACHIKQFLRDRIEQETVERVHHFTMRVVRILCEVSPPKTHVEDMARIVVEEAKRARQDRAKLEKAVETAAERDELLERIREIGKQVGCNHTEDPDGRAKLVGCVAEVLEQERSFAAYCRSCALSGESNPQTFDQWKAYTQAEAERRLARPKVSQ